MLRRTSAAISPTALYTGAVWRRNGLSHPAFATRAGTAAWAGVWLPRRAAELIGGPRLDDMLLARHHAIDTLLEQAITTGAVTQVVELAAGLSPRGWRFTSRHPDLTYVETDLPGMVRRKEEALAHTGGTTPGHRVRVVDAFATSGPDTFAALAGELDPGQGTAIITEGLINYFPLPPVLALWSTIAATLGRFTRGTYITDLHLDAHPGLATATAKVVMGTIVRGSVYLHFEDEQAALDALADAGFDRAELRLPSSFEGVEPAPGVDRNHIVQAWTAREDGPTTSGAA